tara:strand:- start:3758 stop:5995 length:2238 start_codon:yes stop_codon:yes gene_type:complete
MARFFIKFLLLLLIIFISGIIFISYFGIETDKFDSLIKSKANEVNRHVKLGFQKTKIHLNLEELNLVVKLQNPKILVKNDEIALSKLDLFLPLRSFFTSDFLLKRAEVAFIRNDIKDLTKITNIFLPKIINTRIKKIFSQGEIEGEFIIPFDADGNIRNDYGFSGKVIDASINITKEFNIKNLTTEINHTRENDENIFNIRIRDGSLLDFDLTDSILTLKRKNNETHINSFLKTAGKFNFSKIKKISSLLNININNIEDFKGKTDLKTNIDLKLNNKFRIKKFHYSMNGEVSYAEIYFKKKNNIKKYLPDYNDSIILKDSKIKFIKKNSNNIIELNGLIKIKNEFDSFDLKQIYNFKEKNFDIEGNVDLTNSKVNISNLNYNKDSGKKSEINFNINFVLNKYYNIKKLLYISNKTKIDISKLKLNKNFETDNFKKLEIKTFKDGNKNNDFVVKKAKKVIIFGEIFDAEPLLKSLFKKDERRTLSKKFNSEIKINFDRAITGTNDQVNGFGMIATVKKGSFDKLSLKGNFAENEIVEMSIYQIDNNKRTLQVISDRARPFIKNFDFIKGFEGGKLEYESIISKDTSNSSLIITEFKVSKVPALAQLLTLASLQGIADTLSGEGIRFESFEMKSSSKGNVMNIEDALAIGPAVSILMEGYVDKGKLVSLRGTLVPATKLNAIIASIPLVGDILVGKKTGEGVVGVSFKMKGPPKDIKTTVNPIKTLTPRFIVRAVEKMKKTKKDETK